MTFTDDDLKRLKEQWSEELSDISDEDRHLIPDLKLKLALLTRLEAAEAALGYMARPDGELDGHVYFEAWRKAAGK